MLKTVMLKRVIRDHYKQNIFLQNTSKNMKGENIVN